MEYNKCSLLICKDIIIEICKHLKDKDKLDLLSCNKILNTLKTYILFTSKIYINETILNLKYYNQFTNIIVNDVNIRLPFNTKCLTFGDGFNQNIKGEIPNSVTHLTLNRDFWKKNKKNISKSIICSTFI